MVDLSGFRKMNIYFFGNEEEKEAFLREFVFAYFSRKIPGQYFVTREWNGGPNAEIVYYGKALLKEETEGEIKKYCRRKKLQWTGEELAENLGSYVKNQDNLLKMEKKDRVEILADNHLRVKDAPLDMAYYRRVYNSSEHVRLHFESRMLLQPLVEETLFKVREKKELLLFVIKLYQITMQLFEQGEKYAGMMYYSNIAGVFGIAREYGKEEAFRRYFEAEYEKLGMEAFEEMAFLKALLCKYRAVWETIYENSKELAEDGGLYEEGYYELARQEEQMKQNIKDIDSRFHQAFLKDERLHKIVSGRIHLTFRSVVNIFYGILPVLNLNFLDKNLCCYAIVRFTMEKYDTDWEEIMTERVIVV